MSRKKRPEAVETGPSPYEIGLYGSTMDLYLADAAAKADIPVLEAVYKAEQKKHDRIFGAFRSLTKLWAARDARNAAQNLPYEIHQQLYDGAYKAFRDGRPENLQEILANSEEFKRNSWDRPERILSQTLIFLAGKDPDPL